jgi:hypothetical protein
MEMRASWRKMRNYPKTTKALWLFNTIMVIFNHFMKHLKNIYIYFIMSLLHHLKYTKNDLALMLLNKNQP